MFSARQRMANDEFQRPLLTLHCSGLCCGLCQYYLCSEWSGGARGPRR